MRYNYRDGGQPPDDDDLHDLERVLDYPRTTLMLFAPGGLNRLMRAVDAVQEE